MVKSRDIAVPRAGSILYDMRKSRGYVSLLSPRVQFYHKFRSLTAFLTWLRTERISVCWGCTASDLLSDLDADSHMCDKDIQEIEEGLTFNGGNKINSDSLHALVL